MTLFFFLLDFLLSSLSPFSQSSPSPCFGNAGSTLGTAVGLSASPRAPLVRPTTPVKPWEQVSWGGGWGVGDEDGRQQVSWETGLSPTGSSPQPLLREKCVSKTERKSPQDLLCLSPSDHLHSLYLRGGGGLQSCRKPLASQRHEETDPSSQSLSKEHCPCPHTP